MRFYERGLKFSCTRCSCCCRFDSGYVWLTRSDLETLSKTLHLPREEVVNRYCRVVDIGAMPRLSLGEQPNMDCVFWQNGSCMVYDGRPLQCRTYPFWRPHLESRRDWDELEKHCPGVNIGRTYSADEIDAHASARATEAPLDGRTLSEVRE